MVTAATAELRELRRQIRVWRRGRADTRLVDVISDAYIAVFATLMLSSTAVSLVLNVRTEATESCAPGACTDARAALPWLAGVTLVAGSLAVSRLFGPMLVSPAVATWLLPTPVDRVGLLRPRLVTSGVVAFLVTGVLAAGVSTLSSFPGDTVAAYSVCVAATCLLAVGLAAVCQAHRLSWARPLTWLLAAAVWTGLLLLTVDALPATPSAPRTGNGWAVAAVVTLALAAIAVRRADAALPVVGRDQLTPGGTLVPSLSGALASLDFALVYDVLLARHWRSRSTVPTVRGRGAGSGALVWREVVRLRRSPQLVLVLAAALVVPYLAATVGMGRGVLLVTATTGFLAGTGLFSSLRVLSRTPGLARCLPMTTSALRTASLSVPAALVLVWALGSAAALRDAVDGSWGDAALISVAIGVTASTAAVRWVTGQPPDYRLPLVTSPMGAVPTSLFVSLARGFDALLLGLVPLLVAPTAAGAGISLGLDAVVLAVLLNRP